MSKKPQVYYKQWNATTWINITNYCQIIGLSWNQILSVDLLNFDLEVLLPLDVDDNALALETGNEIVVTTDDSKYSVLANSLYGKIERVIKKPLGWDNTNNIPKFSYNISIRQVDFSNDVFSLDYKDETLLSKIIDDIVGHSQLLGGKPQYIEAIDKAILYGEDIIVYSYESEYVTALQALSNLLQENGYYFRMNYFVEPHTTNGLSIYQQVLIFNSSGIPTQSGSTWLQTINTTDFKRGDFDNSSNLYFIGMKSQPTKLTGETNWQYTEDTDGIVNWLNLIGRYQDYYIENPINNTKAVNVESQVWNVVEDERKDFKLTGVKEILFVANTVETYVLSSPTPTSTIIYVPADDAELMNTGDVIKIIIDGVEYFRTITVDSNKLTLSSALPIVPVGSELVVIVENLDIYNKNDYKDSIVTAIEYSPTPTDTIISIPNIYKDFVFQEYNLKITSGGIDYIRTVLSITDNEITLDIPLPFTPSGGERLEVIGINYATKNGVTKDIDVDGNATIEFLPYDVPHVGSKIIISYYKFTPYSGLRQNTESQQRYGIKLRNEKISYPMTKDQLNRINQLIFDSTPNQSISFTSYRNDICEVGTNISLDINGFATGNFLVNSVQGKLIGSNNKYNLSQYEQQITLSRFKMDIDTILNMFTARTKPKNSSTVNFDEKLAVYEDIEVFDTFDMVFETPTKTYELFTNANTKVYYKFDEGTGTTINDSSGNANHGTIIGTRYNWDVITDLLTHLYLYGVNNTGVASSNPCYIRIPYTSAMKPQTKFTMRYRFQIDDITKYSSLMNIYYVVDGSGNNRVIRCLFYPKDADEMTFYVHIFENTNPNRVLNLKADVPMSNRVTKLLQFAIDFDNDIYNLMVNNVSYTMSIVSNSYPSPTYTNLASISAFTDIINQDNANNYIYLGVQMEQVAVPYNCIQAILAKFAFDLEYRTAEQHTADYNNF